MADIDEINRQIAELTTRLDNDLARIRDMEIRVAALEAAAQSTRTSGSMEPQAISSGSHHPHMATPDWFDGERGAKAEVFVNQVSLYVWGNRATIPTEKDKVAFAISHLTSDAALWAAPILVKLFDHDHLDDHITFKGFLDSFKSTYFDPRRIAKVENAIKSFMKFDLSAGEFNYRKENNLCYYCGKANHSASRCNKRKSDQRKGKERRRNLARDSDTSNTREESST